MAPNCRCAISFHGQPHSAWNRQQTYLFYMLRRKSKKPAKQFNLLIAGHPRTGKTDFIHTLYETLTVHKLIPDNDQVDGVLFPLDVDRPTPSSCRIECNDAYGDSKILLRLIDCPGMDIPTGIHKLSSSNLDVHKKAGAYIDQVVGYIESQFDATLAQESKVSRDPNSLDFQVHACMYLLNPDIILASKGLTQMDIQVLETLSSKVNLIPCLGKSVIIIN